MITNVDHTRRSLLTFFALVLGLSVPFFWLGALTDVQLMPGLSVGVLAAFCPMLAALLLVYRDNRTDGVTALLRRSLDFRRIEATRWYVPTLLLMPGISVLTYGLMRWSGGPVPAPHVSAVSTLLMALAFFIGALGEELGWSGYALDPLLGRMSALLSGLTLGAVAIIWHLVPLILLHRPATWIAWWCVYAVSSRVLIVWLYNNTNGSVFAVALFHATLNLAYMLFPINGSHFDMRLGGLLTAFAAAAVTVVWGPATLTRHARSSMSER